MYKNLLKLSPQSNKFNKSLSLTNLLQSTTTTTTTKSNYNNNNNFINTNTNTNKNFCTDNNNKNNDFDKEGQLVNLEDSLKKHLPKELYDESTRLLFGKAPKDLSLPSSAIEHSKQNNYELKSFSIEAQPEQLREKRLVKVGAIQTKLPCKTNLPVKEVMKAVFERHETIIKGAALAGVNVLCLQETWTAPFFFCTRELTPWLEYAESAEHGESTQMLKELAKKYNMVIISPILEREDHKEVFWNTAVVIDNHGDYLGKFHKFHIPRVYDFNESTYYMEGRLGNPVFVTDFGKIGINICYGRHHPLHWNALGLNGAELVFNPSATVGALSEPLWSIEARNAAIANHYFTVGINRVGTEVFENEFTSGDGKPPHKDFGHFYGSTYVAAPDGSRTPGLSRTDDGLLVTEVDLNLCRQIKDKWRFTMSGRQEFYGKLLTKYSKPDFEPDHITKNGNKDKK